MPELTVAVTGATGFIGQLLVQSLIKKGWKVRALTRSPRVSNENIEWIMGDLGNQVALQSLVKNVFAVIHCAGVVRGGSFKEFAYNNVDGTNNLVNVSIKQIPPPKFLFVSSLAAREPSLSWYAKSKYLAEQIVSDNSGIMPWTIFRPTAVYGPGDKELSPLLRATRYGVLPMVGKKTARYSLIHVSDLVSAMLCWLITNEHIKGVYEIDDGTHGGYSCYSLASIAQDVWKRPVRCFFIPVTLVSLFAEINLWLAGILQYSPMLTPGKVREIRHPDWVCDISPLAQVLPNWQPGVRLRDALMKAI
ncbi:MAG: epimerase [Nitrosomonadaceae bacterium]|nr:epimerase [Nitrosomonadaceae bacterium]|tara:strand:+ start:1430 stop:2344 length:915 start_codon:yes stop_codon:yes gene_type:complete